MALKKPRERGAFFIFCPNTHELSSERFTRLHTTDELLLICTKGSCTPEKRKLYDSVVSIPRTKHSKKPEYFADLIDELYPSGNRIELFARDKKQGWHVWGNEVEDSIDLSQYYS